MPAKLFIGGLAAHLSEMELAQLVGPYGDILTVKIVHDKITRKSKGYAFVEMADKAAAGLAIDALDGKVVNGRELVLNIHEEEAVPVIPVYKKVERGNSGIKKKRPRLLR